MIRLEYDKDSDVEGIETTKEGDFIKIRLVYYWGGTKRIVTLSQEEAQKLVQELQKLLPQNEPAIGIDTVTGIVKYYECVPGTTKVVRKVNITSSAESSVQTLQELLEIAKEVVERKVKYND